MSVVSGDSGFAGSPLPSPPGSGALEGRTVEKLPLAGQLRLPFPEIALEGSLKKHRFSDESQRDRESPIENFNSLVRDNPSYVAKTEDEIAFLNGCVAAYSRGESGEAEVIIAICKAGANVELAPFLKEAIKEERFERAFWLLAAGAAMKEVPIEEQRKLIAFILEEIADVDLNKHPVLGQFDPQLLQEFRDRAVENGDNADLRKLLLLGASPNAVDKAIKSDEMRAAYILVAHGGETGGLSNDERDRLMDYMLDSANVPVRELLANEAIMQWLQSDAPKKMVEDRFMAHCKAADFEKAKELLLVGVDVETKDADGKTAFSYAASSRNREMLLLLLRSGKMVSDSEQKIVESAGLTGINRLISALQARGELLRKALPAFISDREVRKLAYVIEVELPKLQSVTMQQLKKGEFGLEHSLLYKVDGTGRRWLFLQRKREGDLEAIASYKRISEAIEVPLTMNQGEAQAIRVAEVISRKDLKTKELNEVRRDFELLVSLQGQPGIWKLHTVLDFAQITKEGEEVGRVAGLLVAALGNYAEVKLDPKEMIAISQHLAIGLANLHALKVIHGDIKGKNALIGEHEAGLIDFGMSFRSGEPVHDVLARGWYGTASFTAPELLGTINFAGSWEAVDTFAFGMMLYEKQKGAFAPWATILTKYTQASQLPSVEDKQAVRESIENEIDKPLREGTISDPLQKLIYRCLQSDPTKRPTMAQVAQELHTLALT